MTGGGRADENEDGAGLNELDAQRTPQMSPVRGRRRRRSRTGGIADPGPLRRSPRASPRASPRSGLGGSYEVSPRLVQRVAMVAAAADDPDDIRMDEEEARLCALLDALERRHAAQLNPLTRKQRKHRQGKPLPYS